MDVLTHYECSIKNIGKKSAYLELGQHKDLAFLPQLVWPKVVEGVQVNGRSTKGIWDTGATGVSMPEWLGKECELHTVDLDEPIKVIGNEGSEMASKGFVDVRLSYMDKIIKTDVFVSDEDPNATFGMELIRRFSSISFSAQAVALE